LSVPLGALELLYHFAVCHPYQCQGLCIGDGRLKLDDRTLGMEVALPGGGIGPLSPPGLRALERIVQGLSLSIVGG
jgi:hypothetical protein